MNTATNLTSRALASFFSGAISCSSSSSSFPIVQSLCLPLASARSTFNFRRCFVSNASASSSASGSAAQASSKVLSSISAPPRSTAAAPAAPNVNGFVVGDTIYRSLDLSQVFIGQVIEPPYEVTVGESTVGMWSSTFFTHDRIYTSVPFAQSLSFASTPLPFTLMLFKATSMSHVDEKINVLDLSYDHAVYIRPGFIGDTFRQLFTIKHLRNTRDGKSSIVTVGCELINQKNQLVFAVDKVMLYPNTTATYKLSQAPTTKSEPHRSHVLSHVLYHGESISPQLSHSNHPITQTTSHHHQPHLAVLHPGALILHSDGRPIGHSNNMSLSTLFRWAHPSIYNMKRYKEEDRLVAGGLLVAATLSSSSRGLFEILYDEIESASLINTCAPNDLIGAITYIKSIKSVKEGFEELRVCTVGIKKIDVAQELKEKSLPVNLFLEKDLRPQQVEQLCKDHVPILNNQIVAIIHRIIVRQSPYAHQKSIPLL